MSKFNENDKNNFHIGICKLNFKQKKIIFNNPHCAEFFCTMNNILDCTTCLNYLNQKKIKIKNKVNINGITFKSDEYCDKHCSNGFIYDFISNNLNSKTNLYNVDKYKIIKNFYQNELIYKYDQIPYKFDYEISVPKPKSVVHWGQLKMFLVTLMFLLKVVDPNEKEVHIIYPGSARGDNILILCDMFPNTRWYLIDPAPFHPKLKTHNQIIEIKNEYFTDDVAKYYGGKLSNKKHTLLFISDIRIDPDDESIIRDQESNIRWHTIISPKFSYLKFRCPYETTKIYSYYDGKIYIQPFAPESSTESRLMLENKLIKKDYAIDEYNGKFIYFNRILRPSYYTKKIIPKDKYFDNCYDCTYYSYLIQNYIKKFSNVNPFKTDDVFQIMKHIVNIISKLTVDKIAYQNAYIRRNMIK